MQVFCVAQQENMHVHILQSSVNRIFLSILFLRLALAGKYTKQYSIFKKYHNRFNERVRKVYVFIPQKVYCPT